MNDSHNKLIFGCMGLGGDWQNPHISDDDRRLANSAIDAALDAGIRCFDHADIYTQGKAEQLFGEILKARPNLRKEINIQSKCGIRFADDNAPARYDFSLDWITSSVDGILTRLGIEQLDVLMLHRPDPLMEPEQVAHAFDTLLQQGKVKQFGVSNMNATQMQFLQHYLSQPLVVNQVELSLAHRAFIEDGISSGNSAMAPVNYGTGTLEYCRLNKVQLQAWGSLAKGQFSGAAGDASNPAVRATAKLVEQLAHEHQTSAEAIVLAWLMRHPADIRPIIGTTNSQRIRDCAKAHKVTLSREEWYGLWVSARGQGMP
ncbi:aldo/keto reductase [Paraferrimonas haliotis]|uniref:Aldo/keto reductase n=1 Tax=Paraferrimonas haliotis TaxID=2013866 RepID=A0AA37WYF2_9GAMM|nr:aldo/keto reductase [Paraferrimonas haliotis]GLS83001.1 aldo/keto reductase [Paraferrimonas haliotis]